MPLPGRNRLLITALGVRLPWGGTRKAQLAADGDRLLTLPDPKGQGGQGPGSDLAPEMSMVALS